MGPRGGGRRRSSGGEATGGEALGPSVDRAARVQWRAMVKTRVGRRSSWMGNRGPLGVGEVDGHETPALKRGRMLRQSRRDRRGWELGINRTWVTLPLAGSRIYQGPPVCS